MSEEETDDDGEQNYGLHSKRVYVYEPDYRSEKVSQRKEINLKCIVLTFFFLWWQERFFSYNFFSLIWIK